MIASFTAIKKLLKWWGVVAGTIILAIAACAAVWFLTLTRHNIDQCYNAVRNYGLPERDGFRLYYGCDEAARKGMKNNELKAFIFAGLYSGIVDQDPAKAREYLYQAIRRGDNRSKIDLHIILTNIGQTFPCEEKVSLLTSYDPEDQSRRDHKFVELWDLKKQGCYKGPLVEPEGWIE